MGFKRKIQRRAASRLVGELQKEMAISGGAIKEAAREAKVKPSLFGRLGVLIAAAQPETEQSEG